MKRYLVVAISITFLLSLWSGVFPVSRKRPPETRVPVVVPEGIQHFFPIRVQGFFGLIDDKGNVVIEPSYRDVSKASLDHFGYTQDYFLGQKNVLLFTTSYWLYVSDKGAQEFAPQVREDPIAINRLDTIFSIFDGSALSMPSDEFGWLPLMTFDPTGRWQAPADFHARSPVFENRVFVVSNTKPTDGSKKKAGLADRNGKIIVPPKFDDFRPFSEGRAGVKIDGKWGFIDLDGNVVIPPKYIGFTWFDQGKAMVYEEGRERMYFIDKMGNELHEFPLDWKMGRRDPSIGFVNGLRFMEKPTSRSGGRRYGYVSPTGDWLGEVDLDYLPGSNDWSDDASVVYRMDTFKYCILDRNGEFRGDPPGASWLNFRYGLASDRDGKVGYINKEGKLVWHP